MQLFNQRKRLPLFFTKFLVGGNIYIFFYPYTKYDS